MAHKSRNAKSRKALHYWVIDNGKLMPRARFTKDEATAAARHIFSLTGCSYMSYECYCGTWHITPMRGPSWRHRALVSAGVLGKNGPPRRNVMTISRMIDLKYGITDDGKLVKVFEDGEIEEVPHDEPTILFRGRDKLAVSMLHYYMELCREDGATDYQITSMRTIINRFQEHKDNNVTKQPGITKGLKWDGVQS